MKEDFLKIYSLIEVKKAFVVENQVSSSKQLQQNGWRENAVHPTNRNGLGL